MTWSDPGLHIFAHRGESLVSRLIRWQTRSEVNHISVRVGDLVYEAMEGHGVRARPLRDIIARVHANQEDVTALRVSGLPVDAIGDIEDFLQSQLGKPYDWTMVARFVSRRNRESNASQQAWFCSELAYTALARSGVYLLRETAAWEVSPGLLVRSPLLRAEAPDDWLPALGAA